MTFATHPENVPLVCGFWLAATVMKNMKMREEAQHHESRNEFGEHTSAFWVCSINTIFFKTVQRFFFTMFQDIFVCGVQTIAEIVINHRRSCQADFPHFLRQRRNGAFFEDRREGASWDRKMGPWRGRTLLEDRSTFGRVYTMSVAS